MPGQNLERHERKPSWEREEKRRSLNDQDLGIFVSKSGQLFPTFEFFSQTFWKNEQESKGTVSHSRFAAKFWPCIISHFWVELHCDGNRKVCFPFPLAFSPSNSRSFFASFLTLLSRQPPFAQQNAAVETKSRASRKVLSEFVGSSPFLVTATDILSPGIRSREKTEMCRVLVKCCSFFRCEKELWMRNENR